MYMYKATFKLERVGFTTVRPSRSSTTEEGVVEVSLMVVTTEDIDAMNRIGQLLAVELEERATQKQLAKDNPDASQKRPLKRRELAQLEEDEEENL